ncbi:MAG: hypothetical protein NDJ94_24065 [Vicinamibacteria bacterium]|nr:hypothetical protein [Vicinamibacteria bacterium]
MNRSFGVAAVFLGAVLTSAAQAQSVKAEGALILSAADGKAEGQLVWAGGETVSKKKVRIRFTLQQGPDGAFAGYGYARAGIAELKPGDRVMLFVRDIDFLRHRGELSGWVEGTKVKGAWKALTIESADLTEATARLSVKESLTLTTGASITTLEFGTVDGYLRQGLEAAGAAAAATPTAVAPVASPAAPASVGRVDVTPAVFKRILEEKMTEADVVALLGPGKLSDRPGVPSNMKELVFEGEQGSLTIQFRDGRASGGMSSFRQPQ